MKSLVLLANLIALVHSVATAITKRDPLCAPIPNFIDTPNTTVAFLFLVDHAFDNEKIEGQKRFYEYLACQIPVDPHFLVSPIHALVSHPNDPTVKYSPDHLGLSDRLHKKLDFDMSMYKSQVSSTDMSRCSRMFNVHHILQSFDFVRDAQVHTHIVLTVDDRDDDFVNDCGPSYVFRAQARGTTQTELPVHIYLHIIRVGPVKRISAVGERMAFKDWNGEYINEKEVARLSSSWLPDALTGRMFNDVIMRDDDETTVEGRTETFSTEATPTSMGVELTESSEVPRATSSEVGTTTVGGMKTTKASSLGTTIMTMTSSAVETTKLGVSSSANEAVLHIRAEKFALAEAQVVLSSTTTTSGNSADNSTLAASTTEGLEKTTEDDDRKFMGMDLPFSSIWFIFLLIIAILSLLLVLWLLCFILCFAPCCCHGKRKRTKGKYEVVNMDSEKETERELFEVDNTMLEGGHLPSRMMVSKHLRKSREIEVPKSSSTSTASSKSFGKDNFEEDTTGGSSKSDAKNA